MLSKSKTPLPVEFWAPWCSFCKQLNPILEEVAKNHPGGITFARVNIDEAASLANKFGVLAIPILGVFCEVASTTSDELSSSVP